MAGDPFLSDPKSRKKRTRNNRNTSTTTKSNKKSKPTAEELADEEISGISDSDDEQGNVSYDDAKENPEDDSEDVDSEEEFGQESAADKRRRLAKQYLDNLKQETEDYEFDAQDLDNDIIAKRLREDVAETKGHVYRFIADNLLLSDIKPTITRVGSKALTGLSVRFPNAYTVSKDMELIKWDIKDFKRKPQRVKHTRGGKRFTEISNEPKNNGHCDEILTVAASPDGKYVVTGGRDKRLMVWSTESLAPLRALDTRDRRGEVLGLTFRRGSDQLYASCADLKVRSYSINQFAQLEILYGHQDHVVDISALGQERCVTVGSRDRTAMLWKIADETRLTFRGGEFEKKKKKKKDGEDDLMDIDDEKFYSEGSIDCVSMIDDSHFVTGSDNGSISLWSLAKKKPLHIQHLAHGVLPEFTSEQASAESDAQKRDLQIPEAQPYWITSIHAIPYSNVFISGSWNGKLKVWKLDEKLRSFSLLGELPNARGVVTRIDVAEYGNNNQESFRVIAALSKEHRLGRWIDAGSGARNSIYSVVIDQQILKN
ncbi:putative WD repeat-containing protein [Wickerhamomyces ciferrii]|uniref:WD repeat-containing protein n=1 Tax=Wickerhamomyces ciferrii (strain ATCC 14091 / BCRC 22168 / CBS 111 / JCM 3599 / NBRC 0793 / NRRL Y-1031 F-60-10) TaxID=1206466 RepID=K0KH41_WICCF|nr:putative WD repeat-containing protein [Wickerhamomyces ciferrii]CCH42291.1 putative WD repeat-containing protein [Wickerhamomyces ciferrii]